MTIIPPRTWRVIGRWKDDTPEAYIPLSPGPRSRAVLQRMIDGPSEEERAMRAQELAERLQAEAVERRLRKIRHLALVSMHDGVLKRLLEEHAPHEQEEQGRVHEECRGCPETHDSEYGEYYQSWPCPTWQTISDSTP